MKMDAIRLRLPGAGKVYLSLALSRFTRILGTLLHNGIPILQALRIAKDSTGNKVLAQAIDKSAENIKAGDSLATPLAASRHFPRESGPEIGVLSQFRPDYLDRYLAPSRRPAQIDAAHATRAQPPFEPVRSYLCRILRLQLIQLAHPPRRTSLTRSRRKSRN